MARIPLISDHEAGPPVVKILQRLRAGGGSVPDLYRAAAARPRQLETLVAHTHAVMRDGAVPALLKELLAVRVSSLNHCLSALASRTAEARALGAKEQWLLAVRHEEPEPGAGGTGSLDGLPPEWIVALRYSELLTESGHRVSHEVFMNLLQGWDVNAVLELTHVVGLTAYLNRFADAFHISPSE